MQATGEHGKQESSEAGIGGGTHEEDEGLGGFGATYDGVGVTGPTWQTRPVAPVLPRLPNIGTGYEVCQSA